GEAVGRSLDRLLGEVLLVGHEQLPLCRAVVDRDVRGAGERELLDALPSELHGFGLDVAAELGDGAEPAQERARLLLVVDLLDEQNSRDGPRARVDRHRVLALQQRVDVVLERQPEHAFDLAELRLEVRHALTDESESSCSNACLKSLLSASLSPADAVLKRSSLARESAIATQSPT